MRHLLASGIVFLAMVLNGSATAQNQTVRILPPPNVNMQIEGTDVLQDGACVTYYKTRDRGEGSARASRGDLVWTVRDGVVLEPGRGVTDGNGALGIENGYGYLYVVDKGNGLLRIPIPGWTVGACAP